MTAPDKLLAEVEPAAWASKEALRYIKSHGFATFAKRESWDYKLALYTRDQVTSLLASMRAEHERQLAELRHKLAELHVAFDVETDRAEAAEAHLKEAEWQDISTAPKDGREILIGGCSYGPSVRTAHWGATAFNRKTQTYDRGWASGINYGFNPTKWMPLPTAPHPEQKGENDAT